MTAEALRASKKEGGDAAGREEAAAARDLVLVDTPTSRGAIGLLGTWLVLDGLSAFAGGHVLGTMDMMLGGFLLARAREGRPFTGARRIAFPALLTLYFGLETLSTLGTASTLDLGISVILTLCCAVMLTRRLREPEGTPGQHVIETLQARGALDAAYGEGGLRDTTGARLLNLGCGGFSLLLGGGTLLLAWVAAVPLYALSGLVFSLLGVGYLRLAITGRSYALELREEGEEAEDLPPPPDHS